MKKTSFALLLTIIGFAIIYGVFVYMKNYKETNKEDEPPVVEKYKYEDKLSLLGYEKETIDQIKDTFDDSEVESYLLEKKYENLLEYKESTIFNLDNLNRYDLYNTANLDKYTPVDVVTYVEIGLDKEFYTDIKVIDNYDDKLVLVNKYYSLPSKYKASDLVKLSTTYASNSKKELKREAADAMKSMIDAGKKDGVKMKVISAYRTESEQNSLFTNSKKRNGLEHALIYSAKPGHSEHQTGYAADINTVQESFKNTKEYTWLKDNAYKYGFIERYPKGKEFITGYGYEPWHYRYVGIEVASIIQEKQITFEEYYVLYMNGD